jgi:hypothetical protein
MLRLKEITFELEQLWKKMVETFNQTSFRMLETKS